MPVGDARRQVRPSRQNLARLWLIRSILVVVLLLVLFYLRFYSEFELPWVQLLAALATMVLINIGLYFRTKSSAPVGENEFFANLVLDILFLTVVLYYSGGSTNPLVSYYLIPLIISAAVLSQRHTWGIAFLTMACYTLLFFKFIPFDIFAIPDHGSRPGAHFWGMWINFAFSALLIAWFVVRMAETMREQAQWVSKAREKNLRDEQIISVASIAAGTAHELRTPLATITVVLDEMANDHPELQEEMMLLHGQLERCDSILRELVSATTDSSQVRLTTIKQLFDEIQQKWMIARPEVPLIADLDSEAAELNIEYDQSLHQSLLNFLHNAADASPGLVQLKAGIESDSMALVRVQDRGPGIPEDVVSALGKRHLNRKEGGLGLGVLLSSATIERLGGRVLLLNRSGGGTCVEIHMPIHCRGNVES